jgi:hypothetical protein
MTFKRPDLIKTVKKAEKLFTRNRLPRRACSESLKCFLQIISGQTVIIHFFIKTRIIVYKTLKVNTIKPASRIFQQFGINNLHNLFFYTTFKNQFNVDEKFMFHS